MLVSFGPASGKVPRLVVGDSSDDDAGWVHRALASDNGTVRLERLRGDENPRPLLTAMRSKGLTQVDFAGALGLAQGLVSKYETGDLLLHGELIVEFARVLGVSADDILPRA